MACRSELKTSSTRRACQPSRIRRRRTPRLAMETRPLPPGSVPPVRSFSESARRSNSPAWACRLQPGTPGTSRTPPADQVQDLVLRLAGAWSRPRLERRPAVRIFAPPPTAALPDSSQRMAPSRVKGCCPFRGPWTTRGLSPAQQPTFHWSLAPSHASPSSNRRPQGPGGLASSGSSSSKEANLP